MNRHQADLSAAARPRRALAPGLGRRTRRRGGDRARPLRVNATPGSTDTALRQRLQTALGTGYTISIKEGQAQSSAAQISAFLGVVTDALLGFAALAVLVGIFLIFNTFAMLVAQRTRELGLLRALGASRALWGARSRA